MQVTREPFQDVGERDAAGFYEAYYSGFLYRFDFGGEVLVARQYDDTPEGAAFLERWVNHGRTRKPRRFENVPYDDASFREAVQYLLRHENVTTVHVFLDQYVPVDLNRLLETGCR